MAVSSAGLFDAPNQISYSSLGQHPGHFGALAYAPQPPVGVQYAPNPALLPSKYASPIVGPEPIIPGPYHSSPLLKYADPGPIYAKALVPEPTAPANYEFEYSVNDPHTGDEKSQKEVRVGDQVQGSYSVVDADGTKRTVDYTADAHNGFNAVIRREPAAHPVPVAVKTVPKFAAYAPEPHSYPQFAYGNAPLYHR